MYIWKAVCLNCFSCIFHVAKNTVKSSEPTASAAAALHQITQYAVEMERCRESRNIVYRQANTEEISEEGMFAHIKEWHTL